MSKLEEVNRRLDEQLQSAMDDVGEKTSELETVSIEFDVVNIETVTSTLSLLVITCSSLVCHRVIVNLEVYLWSCKIFGIFCKLTLESFILSTHIELNEYVANDKIHNLITPSWDSLPIKSFTNLAYRIYSRISRQFLAQFWRSSCGSRLIRGSYHAARVDSLAAICQRHWLCVPHPAAVDH